MVWPGTPPKIMGIVNVTPDSFSDGGQFNSVEAAVAHGIRLIEEGADILDIGGESTRPGADVVPEKQELDRVLPVVGELRNRTDVLISIDTRKPVVAAHAIEAGATIWNDVSALTFSSDSIGIARSLDCPLILMHAQGDPKTMQKSPQYGDVVSDVYAFLEERMSACSELGIAKDKIIIDPGIGFGKSLSHNLLLLKNLDRFVPLAPLLVGASRKRFIAAIDIASENSNRLGGSLAAAVMSAQRGAEILRVHDVAQTRQALSVARAIEAIDK